MAFEQTRLLIGLDVHKELTEVRTILRQQRNRKNLSYSEAVHELAVAWLAEHDRLSA